LRQVHRFLPNSAHNADNEIECENLIMELVADSFFNPENFVPSLREALEKRPLNLQKVIRAAIPIDEPKGGAVVLPKGLDRHRILLTDGKGACDWSVDSLQGLFRGNRQPPVLGDYPEAYQDSFALLDAHALEISRLLGDRRDLEMLEIYSALRRRPDGKSLGLVHDFMWQGVAFVLGSRPLSQAEFEAILARLERSCRTFEMGPTSRNYIATLRTTIGQEGPAPG
jgi:hypothetical protein